MFVGPVILILYTNIFGENVAKEDQEIKEWKEEKKGGRSERL